jgi:cytochrome c oxidase subunit 2
MLWTSAAVFAAVLLALTVALVRGVRNRSKDDSSVTSETALSGSVGIATGLTIVVLIGLLTASVLTARTVGSPQASSAITIAITGHQWWWEIQYEDGVPSRRVTTANELHIPINRPVVFKVTSRDVIHSFWVPNLQGKRDLIPGYTTAIWLQADRHGVFRGQCAEFCGMQHAHMALDIVSESDEEFEGWLDAMRQPAGQIAPDLTHIATRSTLGAGTLPNTRENLAAWIQDPQRFKPGNQMPPNPLAADELEALVAYLGTLR